MCALGANQPESHPAAGGSGLSCWLRVIFGLKQISYFTLLFAGVGMAIIYAALGQGRSQDLIISRGDRRRRS